jgi:hypothetical protein
MHSGPADPDAAGPECHHPERATTMSELADRLRADIDCIATELDRRYHNAPGTALRGNYFWHWPPSPTHSVEMLRALHTDACRLLAAAPQNQLTACALSVGPRLRATSTATRSATEAGSRAWRGSSLAATVGPSASESASCDRRRTGPVDYSRLRSPITARSASSMGTGQCETHSAARHRPALGTGARDGDRYRQPPRPHRGKPSPRHRRLPARTAFSELGGLGKRGKPNADRARRAARLQMWNASAHGGVG